MSRLAIVTASERQSPSSSTPDEVQPPIAERKSLKLAMALFRQEMAKKLVLHMYRQHYRLVR